MITSALTSVRIEENDGITAAELLKKAADLSGKKSPVIALVCDNAPIASKTELIASLKKIASVTVLDKVQPNPQVVDIREMNSTLKDADAVIGIGGGSVLDSAKAIAMLRSNGGDLAEYLGASPSRKIEKPSLPLILMPTTGGTGSEVTRVGVYTSETGRKYTLGSTLMQASLAILNARFLLYAPPGLCASTGLDALDHALESIWNKNATPETIAAAQEAAIEVLATLPRVYSSALRIKGGETPSSEDLELRRKMLAASCRAGIAFSVTGTAAGHALSFVLSENWHVPHGTACAFTLPGVFALAAKRKETAAALAPIAAAFNPGITDTDELVSRLGKTIETMMTEMKQPRCFEDIGVTITKKQIDEEFSRSFDDPKMHNQLPVATKENIYPILEALCQRQS